MAILRKIKALVGTKNNIVLLNGEYYDDFLRQEYPRAANNPEAVNYAKNAYKLLGL